MESLIVESLNVRTSHATFGVVGHMHIDQARPALFAVSGAFPPKGHLTYLARMFNNVSVVVIYTPGMVVAPWTDSSIEDQTRGLEELIARLAPDAPVVMFGVSTGNLLALGAKSPNIRRRVALEPFFLTEGLTEFQANARERMAQFPDHTGMRTYYWNTFGIGETALENRDYRHLRDGLSEPTEVICGGARRGVTDLVSDWPSFLADEDRAVLRANPLVSLHEGPADAGHSYGSVPGPGRHVVDALLRASLLATAQR